MGPGRQEQGLDGRICFSSGCTGGEDQAHVGAPPPHPIPPPHLPYPEISPAQGWCSAILPTPTPTAVPRGLGGLERGGCLALATPTSRLLGCRHLFPGPGPVNPRPKHTTSRPSDRGGVVWGGTGRDPSLPAIQFSPAFPRARNWVLVPPCLPGASLGAGLCTPLSGAPPARPGALPFVVELPGASSSWRAGCRGFPACLPFSAERRERATEREMRRRPAPRLCPGGSVHRLWGRERRRCRLSAAGVGRRAELRTPVFLYAGPEAGEGCTAAPAKTPKWTDSGGVGMGGCASPRAELRLEGPSA